MDSIAPSKDLRVGPNLLSLSVKVFGRGTAYDARLRKRCFDGENALHFSKERLHKCVHYGRLPSVIRECQINTKLARRQQSVRKTITSGATSASGSRALNGRWRDDNTRTNTPLA